MPWYKLTSWHGPGHQSGHRLGEKPNPDDYHFRDWFLSKDERREAWEYLTREQENPVGDFTRVHHLPLVVRKAKIEEFRRSRKYALDRIRELEKMR